MHRHTIATLVGLAVDGSIPALMRLMALAIADRTFMARSAAKALWDHFGIKAHPCS